MDYRISIKIQMLLKDMDNLEKLMRSEWSDDISYLSLGTLCKRNLTSQIVSQLLKTWMCCENIPFTRLSLVETP